MPLAEASVRTRVSCLGSLGGQSPQLEERCSAPADTPVDAVDIAKLGQCTSFHLWYPTRASSLHRPDVLVPIQWAALVFVRIVPLVTLYVNI